MIGPPDIHGLGKSPPPFVDVIRDIRGKIGILSVLLPDHAVLVILENRGLDPQGPVLFIELSFLLGQFKTFIQEARGIQITLSVPYVKGDSEISEIPFDLLEHPLLPFFGAKSDGLLHFHGSEIDFPGNLLSQIHDIVPKVPILRKRVPGFAHLLPATVNGFPQEPYLQTRVIDVKLTSHIIPGKGKNPTKGVAQGRPAPVPQMKRPGGIGAYKFNHDLLILTQITSPLLLSLFNDLGQKPLPFLSLYREINKTRARYLGLFQKIPVVFQFFNDGGGDIQRSAPLGGSEC